MAVAGKRAGVTMHDVAAIAGVSIKTVSNVINGYPYIRGLPRLVDPSETVAPIVQERSPAKES